MNRHGSTCLEGPVSRSRACWASEAEGNSEIRHDLVARVRREIAAGEYDTPEKMDKALDRLLMSLERA